MASGASGPWRLLPLSLVVYYGQVRSAELPPFPQVLLLSVKSLKSSSCATRKGLRLVKNHTNITSLPTNYRRSSNQEYGAGVQGCTFHPITEAIKDPALSLLPSPFSYSHPASLALPRAQRFVLVQSHQMSVLRGALSAWGTSCVLRLRVFRFSSRCFHF